MDVARLGLVGGCTVCHAPSAGRRCVAAQARGTRYAVRWLRWLRSYATVQWWTCAAHAVDRSVVGNVTPKRRVQVLMCGGLWRAARVERAKGTRTEFNLATEP